MSNFLYGKGKEKLWGLMTGSLNYSASGPNGLHTLKAALVSNAYSPVAATHEFYNDLGANVLNSNQTLGAVTTTLGVLDANDVTWTAVTAGSVAKAVVLFLQNTGASTTWPLIAYIDTITGFPLNTNGGDITVVWDSGAYKIVSL